ncbi:MAG: hypothetical protein AAFZ18_13295 [Myxococcota bacterium]
MTHTLGQRVKLDRDALNITQAELVTRIKNKGHAKANLSWLHRLEYDKARREPSEQLRRWLSEALEQPADDYLALPLRPPPTEVVVETRLLKASKVTVSVGENAGLLAEDYRAIAILTQLIFEQEATLLLLCSPSSSGEPTGVQRLFATCLALAYRLQEEPEYERKNSTAVRRLAKTLVEELAEEKTTGEPRTVPLLRDHWMMLTENCHVLVGKPSEWFSPYSYFFTESLGRVAIAFGPSKTLLSAKEATKLDKHLTKQLLSAKHSPLRFADVEDALAPELILTRDS